jgi:hypothetical protein
MSRRFIVLLGLFACGGGTNSIGEGVLAISTTTVDFGMISIGVPATRNVVVSNRGDAPLMISTIATSSAVFTATAAAPAELDPGAALKIAVAFQPTTVMAATDQLVVDSDAGSVAADLTGTGAHSVSLTWNASTSSGVIGYNVYRSEASGAFYMRINDRLVPDTAYTDFTIETCKTYYYVVTAVNEAALESGYSAETAKEVPCF